MTAVSPKWRIKQKFQAGHTENDSGQGDLTDFSITHSLPYSVTESGYVTLWPSFPRLRLPVFLTRVAKRSHTCTNTHMPTCFYQIFKKNISVVFCENSCWESLNVHRVFQGRTVIVSVIKRSCMTTADSEPLRGSIPNVCVLTLPGSSSTKSHHLPRLH